MSTSSTSLSYNLISRVNHWVIAIAMIGMLLFGFYLSKIMPKGPEVASFLAVHKAIGVLILVFGAWRVIYRLRQGFLPEAVVMPKWQEITAKAAHIILLAGIVLMPVSGVMGSFFGGHSISMFGLFTIPGGPEIKLLSDIGHVVHGYVAIVLAVVVGLHVAGVLKHQFIDRDITLKRMTGRA